MCPLSGLLEVEQRQASAGRLNAAVLQSQQQEKGPWLPDLLRQLVYSQVWACTRKCSSFRSTPDDFETLKKIARESLAYVRTGRLVETFSVKRPGV